MRMHGHAGTKNGVTSRRRLPTSHANTNEQVNRVSGIPNLGCQSIVIALETVNGRTMVSNVRSTGKLSTNSGDIARLLVM